MHEIKATVSVEISFYETQVEELDYADVESEEWLGSDQRYMGVISIIKDMTVGGGGVEIFVNVQINLPVQAYSELMLMNGKNIKFETIHDVIGAPSKNQREDNLVAMVKRVYFEVKNNTQ